jgi:hypothetical protein
MACARALDEGQDAVLPEGEPVDCSPIWLRSRVGHRVTVVVGCGRCRSRATRESARPVAERNPAHLHTHQNFFIRPTGGRPTTAGTTENEMFVALSWFAKQAQ